MNVSKFTINLSKYLLIPITAIIIVLIAYVNIHKPSDMVSYYALMISLGLLVFNICKYVMDKTEYIKGEYWIKTIFVPMCIEPLRQFIEKQSIGIRKLHNDNINKDLAGVRSSNSNKYLCEFKIEKENIASRFLVLQSINNYTYKNIVNSLDEIEDMVAEYCAFNTLDPDNIDKGKCLGLYHKAEQGMFHSLRKIIDEIIMQSDKC